MPKPHDPRRATQTPGSPRATQPRSAAKPAAESLFTIEEPSLSKPNSPTLRIKARSTGDLADVLAAGEKFGPLSVSDLAALELTEGSAWTADLKARVTLAVRRRACLRKAMTLLAARPRSERELLDRLTAARFDPAISDAALATLRLQGLINDNALAESIIEKAARRGDAQPNIDRAFQRRGLESDNPSAAHAPPANDEAAATQLARSLLTQHSRSAKAPRTSANAFKERRKIYAALLRRGFDEDTADRAAATAVGSLAQEIQGPDE